MKKYEIMYIVNASLDDAARQNVMERLHGIITSQEGSIDKIDEKKKGYYVVINVTANNEGIQEFQRLARINNNIVRFMVVKTQGEE